MSEPFRFKPSDFYLNHFIQGATNFDRSALCAEAANEANKLLIGYLKTLSILYAQKPDGISENWNHVPREIDTHRCLAWGIEELKPRECEHNGVVSFLKPEPPGQYGLAPTGYRCAKCGVKLKATWSVCE